MGHTPRRAPCRASTAFTLSFRRRLPGKARLLVEQLMQSGTRAERDFALGIDGFTFHDLFRPARLKDLDGQFRARLATRDAALSARFEEYRGGAAFSVVDESNLL